MNDIFRHEHSVVGAPGLGAFRVERTAFRHFVYRLEAHFAGHFVCIFGQHFLTEVRLEILTDDEDDLAEPCAQGVKNTVVHDGLAVRAESVKLFESAVAASHAGGQDK